METELDVQALQRENAELRARLADLEGTGRCVHEVLEESTQALLEEWEQRVLHDPVVSEADRISRPALRDHVPALVQELSAALKRAGGARSTLGERLGRTVWHSPNALAHAETRFQQGYTLAEVMRELSHFRAAVVERCRREGALLSREELYIVHIAIDEAMTVAAAELERIARVELRASEQRYRTLVDSVQDYAVFLLDAEGRVATWNDAAERIEGWSEDEILGQPHTVFFTAEARAADEPQRLLAEARLRGSHRGRYPRVRRDGSVFDADVSIAAIFGPSGGVAGYSKVVRDVSEQLAAEQARREAELRLQAILDNAFALIFVKDLEGRYELVNRRFEEVYGMPGRDVVGRTDAELFPERMAETFRQNDLEVLASGTAVEAEEVAGGRTYISIKFPLRDLSGKIRATAGIATDITERVQAREALERAVELRELFVGVLAHDLRAPLQVVGTAAAVLQRMHLDPGVQRTVERVATATRRMSTMVDQLLDVTRAQAGQPMPLDRRPTDLGEVCRGAVDALLSVHTDRTIDVRVEGDVRGQWDESRLEQLVGNLLSNALSYSPAGSPVHVRARGLRDAVCLEVCNANADAPLSTETLQRLFDPFARGSRPSSSGLGLGLFIVEEIAEAHGGHVEARSDEGGSTFAVWLPRQR